MVERTNVPVNIKREVLMEAGYRCAVPRCRNILALDLHHMVPVAEDGPNEASNLIALCGFCHDMYHRGEFPHDAILNWKGILIAINFAFDKQSIDDLFFLSGLSDRSLGISGDGVLHFSNLISAGLASFKILMKNGPILLYSVELTGKGRALVKAWIAGNRDEVEHALRIQ